MTRNGKRYGYRMPLLYKNMSGLPGQWGKTRVYILQRELVSSKLFPGLFLEAAK
jgi:hypothetical protein